MTGIHGRTGTCHHRCDFSTRSKYQGVEFLGSFIYVIFSSDGCRKLEFLKFYSLEINKSKRCTIYCSEKQIKSFYITSLFILSIFSQLSLEF